MINEFRKDPVSGDWIIIAPKRGKRPDQFIKKEKRIIPSTKECPFEDPQLVGNGVPFIALPGIKNWKVQVIQNKFPALIHRSACAKSFRKGPYFTMEGQGHHDVVIMRNHYKNIARAKKEDVLFVFRAFIERYEQLKKDLCGCLEYVFIFHNWGPKAGASIYHPHCQIISMPIIPPDVRRSLNGSARYYKEHKKCVHCDMIAYERKEGKRVVFESKHAIVFAPFAAREPFELRVFPKKHNAFFENSAGAELEGIVEALQKALLSLEKSLKDPDYNFFIHTAPLVDGSKYEHYHWHIEVVPKFSISAGFELGTGVEITVVDPDDAATILKKHI